MTFTFLVSCNQEPKVPADSFTVSGTIKGLDTKYMSRSVRDSTGKRITDSIAQLDEKIVRLKTDFVQNNPTSEAAVWYVSDMMIRSQISNEDAVAAFNKFDKSLKDFSYYKEIASRVKGIEATLIGKTVPDFTSNNTLDGSYFTFNSLRVNMC
ncbi:hypothetical protein KCTC32516_00017 [Polaribacter huanghezhanensis]|uniref:hypothetical protein n=1 Tax=Polaribacter huanghezhanensis TaxID=1354726 RepID=UPI00264801A7|nr:hypothetical protein [Polaribacter huanghezhanensis]WKD84683.1 hypothetical protein KCTC32516_00017 [Polaribacter huanghezhanensis]